MYKLLLSHPKEIFRYFFLLSPLFFSLKTKYLFQTIFLFLFISMNLLFRFFPKLRHFNIKISNSANRSFSPQGSTPSPPQTFVITINLFILHLLAEKYWSESTVEKKAAENILHENEIYLRKYSKYF